MSSIKWMLLKFEKLNLNLFRCIIRISVSGGSNELFLLKKFTDTNEKQDQDKIEKFSSSETFECYR